MATYAIKQNTSQTAVFPYRTDRFNKYSILSGVLSCIFIAYFLIPQTESLQPIHNLGAVFMIIVPFLAFIFSLVSFKQISRTHARGSVMSYIALGITSLYFMIGLAIPLVLVGLYIVYTYIL